MASTSPRRVFSTTEPLEAEAVDQRPVRISAFVALLLGLVSAVAILGKPLVAFSVLTVGVALWALRPSRHGPPVGRWAAVTGLLLAVFFGAWGWSQAEVRQRALVQQATRFGHDWLSTLAQGEKEVALELSNHVESRQPETMPLKQYYATEERAKESLQTFLDQDEIQRVLQGGPGQQWQPVGQPVVWQRHGADYVSIKWHETTRGDYYRTNLVRHWDPKQLVGQWRLDGLVAAEESD